MFSRTHDRMVSLRCSSLFQGVSSLYLLDWYAGPCSKAYAVPAPSPHPAPVSRDPGRGLDVIQRKPVPDSHSVRSDGRRIRRIRACVAEVSEQLKRLVRTHGPTAGRQKLGGGPFCKRKWRAANGTERSHFRQMAHLRRQLRVFRKGAPSALKSNAFALPAWGQTFTYTYDSRQVPFCLFTDPEFARVA